MDSVVNPVVEASASSADAASGNSMVWAMVLLAVIAVGIVALLILDNKRGRNR